MWTAAIVIPSAKMRTKTAAKLSKMKSRTARPSCKNPFSRATFHPYFLVWKCSIPDSWKKQSKLGIEEGEKTDLPVQWLVSFYCHLRLLKNSVDVSQYYQWVLGNMCRGVESISSLSSVAQCDSESELKSVINQPVIVAEDITTEFGADHAVITYCEVSCRPLCPKKQVVPFFRVSEFSRFS